MTRIGRWTQGFLLLQAFNMQYITDAILYEGDADEYSQIHRFFWWLKPANRTEVVDLNRRHSLNIITTNMEQMLYYYVFPFQFLLGTIGNSINLVVLLSRSMRSEANTLLASMALADIGVFFTQLIFAITVYEPVYTNNTFRQAIFFTFRQNANAVCNFFSAATCWFVLAVSLERYWGIRFPMTHRLGTANGRIYIIIGLIIFGSFLVTSFHHFEYETGFYWNKNHTHVFPIFNHVLSITSENASHGEEISERIYVKATFVDIGKSVSLITIILLPQIAIAFFNISIIRILRRRNDIVAKFDSQGKDNKDYMRHRHERKVTITVVAIVTCYSVTTIPSAFPFVLELFFKYYHDLNLIENKKYRWIYFTVVPGLTSWTLTGKVMNFILFCLSSVHFRRRLRDVVVGKFLKRSSRYSSILVSSSQYGIFRAGPATRMSSLGERDSTLRRHLSTCSQAEIEYEATSVC